MFRKNIKIQYLSRPYKIINFCKHYILEDNLEVESFNKRFSEPKLRWVLRKRYNYTKRFLKAIAERVGNKSNLIIVVYGTPNSGKSEGGQTIAFYIRYCFWKYRKIRNIEIHFAFSTADFQTILTEMEVGDIGIRDESSKLSGAGSVNVQKYLDNVTAVIRKNQNSFVFIDPSIIEPDVVSYYLESAGKRSVHKCKRCGKKFINLKKDMTRICIKCGGDLKPLYPYCKVRFILYDKNKKILGHVYLPLHMLKLFREKYEEKKDLNIEDVMANAGMVTPEIDGRRLERDTKILLELCKKYGVQRRGEIPGIIARYNSTKKKDKDKIKGDTNYMKVLLSDLYRMIRLGIEKSFTEKRQNKFFNTEFKDGMDFSDFCLKNIEDKRIAKVAQGLTRGDSYRVIEANHPELGYWFIQKTAIMLRNRNSSINLGFLFEQWFALSILKVPKEELSNILGGNTTKPDIEWDGKIWTIKWRYERKSKTLKFRQSVDFAPEFTKAKTENKKYNFGFMNSGWSSTVQTIYDIDPYGDEEIFIKKHEKPMKKLIMDA